MKIRILPAKESHNKDMHTGVLNQELEAFIDIAPFELGLPQIHMYIYLCIV